ncbi:MAG: DUF3853 family protein [Bacteroidales bacterium]|nr:DUF3853 family protein [Bacteroidales bacterium]
MTNPFDLLEARLSNIESLLLDIKHQPITNTTTTEPEPEPLIYGINGLAQYLKVSVPTAQKIKNSGKVPYSQAQRTIIFRKTDVLEALAYKKGRAGAK